MDPFPPSSRLAAYLRDSGGEDQDLSIPQQEDALRAWCLEKGYFLTLVFKDAARPGSSTLGRDAFHAMIQHFRDPACLEVGILVWKFSRFARNLDDAQFYKADLRRRGYVIHSLKDDIPTGLAGRFYETAIDIMNARYLEDLSIDITRGLRDLVTRYRAIPGTPPRGFIRQKIDLDDETRRSGKDHVIHRWIPDPQVAPLVRQAFDLRLSGASLAQINNATHLYSSINSFTTFFSNPLYKGELHYGDLVIPDYCPPMVDPATWEGVQLVAKEFSNRHNLSGDNRLHPRRINSNYILSGLLYCAKCGSPFSGHSHRQKNGQYYQRYACSRAKRKRDCPAAAIPARFLEQTVLATLKDYLLQPSNLAALQDDLDTRQAGSQVELDRQRKELKSLLAGLRRKIDHLTDAIAVSGHTRSLLEKLATFESLETDLLTQLTRLEPSPSVPFRRITPTDIEQNSQQFINQLSTTDRHELKTILGGIIEKIIIERDKKLVYILIRYYYPPQTRTGGCTGGPMCPPDHTCPPDPSDPDTVPLSPPPPGAPPHRHIFPHAFIAPLTTQKRTKLNVS